MIQNHKQFKEAIPVLMKLTDYGYEAYFVGGCVRDLLLDREIKDIDITTNASPDQVKKIFKKVIPVGLAHGTVIVRHEHQSYEVTTYRVKDKKTEQFLFGGKLAQDLNFRDFTINAIAMNQYGELIDLFNGQEDLNKKRIRGVQDPYLRLQEDPLRMVRACRFVSQLGFSIEEKTYEAIIQLKHDTAELAIERLKEEMTKLISGTYFQKSLKYLIDTGLIETFPIFKDNINYVHLLKKEKNNFSSFSHLLAFLHTQDLSVSINQWVKKWKASNKEKKEAEALVEALVNYEKNHLNLWLVYRLQESLHKPFCRIIDTIYNESLDEKHLGSLKNNLSIQNRKDLSISGYHLMKWFPNRKRGKWIEQMIEAIEHAVVMNELENNEEKIKEWILCHPLATN